MDSTLLDDSFWMSLQITYYNMGVELEHLSQYDKAMDCFKQAKQITTDYLGSLDKEMEE